MIATYRNPAMSTSGVICTLYEAYLVGILVRPAINAIVARVEIALREPRDVAVLEASRANGVEGNVPVKCLARDLASYNDGEHP